MHSCDAADGGEMVLGAVCYAAGQTVCNAAWVTCCLGAGGVAGTFTVGAGTPPALMACCAAQGSCMATAAQICSIAGFGATVAAYFAPVAGAVCCVVGACIALPRLLLAFV